MQPLTVTEASRASGISRGTLYRALNDGRLRQFEIHEGGKRLLNPGVVKYLKSGAIRPRADSPWFDTAAPAPAPEPHVEPAEPDGWLEPAEPTDWLPTEPGPAPEPETISAIELADHFQKSLAWVNTLMNRRQILKLSIHYRARRPGESKGYKYFRDVTFAVIAESRQRPPRCGRALEQLADQVLAELVG
ncbi:MAG: hypothetical protein ACKO3F_07545 [Cyanobium sp.]